MMMTGMMRQRRRASVIGESVGGMVSKTNELQRNESRAHS
jgi:ribosomal protein L13